MKKPALLCAAGIGLLSIIAMTTTGHATESGPTRGWAHETGLISLNRSSPVDQASVADRMMIQEAFARWGILWDEGEVDLIDDLFTANGRFRVVKASETSIVDVTGGDTIKANITYALTQQHEQRRHLLTNIVIDRLDGRTAHAIAYSMVIAHQGTPVVDGTVVYSADLVRDDDGVWRFASLAIGLDSYGGEPPKALPLDGSQ